MPKAYDNTTRNLSPYKSSMQPAWVLLHTTLEVFKTAKETVTLDNKFNNESRVYIVGLNRTFANVKISTNFTVHA